MATIQSVIELYDNFSAPLLGVVHAVNQGISVMEGFQAVVSDPVSFSIADSVVEQMNQAVQAIEEAQATLNDTVVTHENSQVNWTNPTMTTFTNSGVDRFEQEVQSANAMLEQLSSTQTEIARRAERIQLFPTHMVNDMNTMQNRIQGIQERIQAIESNPLNFGTSRANAELEGLRSQLNQAVNAQNEMNAALEMMDIETANKAYIRLSQTVSGTERYIRDNTDEQGRFNREIVEGTANANNLMDSIKGVVAAYATIQTMENVIELSDTMVQSTARLDLIVDDGGSVEDLQNKIFLSAERARGSYLTTADAVYKLGSQASQAFSSNDELIAFTELLNKQFVNAGIAAQGVDAAMLQLTQAMASGRLQGDELTSILENATPIVQNIQRYLEEVQGIDASNIKDLAADGVVTADVIKNAMFYAADEINAKFETMPTTFGQIWTSFQNHALIAFQPVLQRMNDLANSEAFQNMVNGAISALSIIAGVALTIFEVISAAGGFIYDNWSILEPLIMGVATALGIYAVYLAITKGAEMASAAGKVILCVASYAHAAATGAEVSATTAATAAQYGLNTALLACPLTWIIVLVIAIIALFYAVIAIINKVAGTSISATGIICGALAAAGAFIWNLVLGALELVLGVINYLINPFIEIANFIGNVFTNPVSSIIYLFQGMADNVLGILQKIASALDFVFGSNMAATVQGWRDGLKSSADALVAEYAPNENYQDVMNNLDLSVEGLGLDRLAYGDAWDAGYNFGEGIDESVGSFDPSSLFDTNVPGADAYSDLSGYGSDISDIAGNTGDIKDSLDITEEDLKYLRDIAEQDTVNRFTTAEIHVEQTNNNNISSSMDLDGVVGGLTDAVNEAIDIMAEGVHE